MNLYIMTRKGTFRPSGLSDNQCARDGHSLYHYIVKVICPGDLRLDKDDFIIKHEDIDEIIQISVLEGSCENMINTIVRNIINLFKVKAIMLLGIKCTIKPKLLPDSYIEKMWTIPTKSGDLIIPLLS